MTLSIMSMTSMSRSRDQTWITSVNGMVARDEGKDSMPGMLKVILMLKKDRKIVICVEASLGSVVSNLFKT